MLANVIREMIPKMNIVGNALEAEYETTSNEIASAQELITAFKMADMRLRLAIEQDRDAEIGQYGDQIDGLVSAMLQFDTDGSSERATMLRFLVDRFVLREDTSTELRRAVCEKLLRLA